MGALVDFGSPAVTLLWVATVLAVFGWLLRQLSLRRLVTIPSYFVLFFFVLPILIQYPFAPSPVNVLAVGAHNHQNYVPFVDRAFLVTLAGMGATLVGYVLCPPGRPDFAPARFVTAGIRTWTQGSFLYVFSLLIIVLFSMMLALGLIGERGARNLAQAAPAIRPLYNVAHTILPFTVAVDFLAAARLRRRSAFVLGVLNVALGVLTGSRAVAFGGILLFLVTVLGYESLRARLSMRRVAAVVPMVLLLLLLVLYLGDVRRGLYNPLVTISRLGILFFYGNNFSDLRDFAWVISYWDGELLLGRTLLAGFLAFIPSALLPFRAEWNIGVVTTSLARLDSSITPGLRPGLFGEPYLNFGLVGVLLGGLALGYVIRRLHRYTVWAVGTHPPVEAHFALMGAFATLGLATRFLNTAGFFSFYLVIGVLLGVRIWDSALRLMRRAGAPPAAWGRGAGTVPERGGG